MTKKFSNNIHNRHFQHNVNQINLKLNKVNSRLINSSIVIDYICREEVNLIICQFSIGKIYYNIDATDSRDRRLKFNKYIKDRFDRIKYG